MFAHGYFPTGYFSGSYFPPPGVVVRTRPAIGYPGPGGQYVDYVSPGMSFEEKKRKRRRWKERKHEEDILLYLLIEELDD